jgi:serine/threonine protein kinase
VIHCDLKPENILYSDIKNMLVKIIDFGSSCTRSEDGFSYVQSRFYRAPEIVLGLPYDF